MQALHNDINRGSDSEDLGEEYEQDRTTNTDKACGGVTRFVVAERRRPSFIGRVIIGSRGEIVVRAEPS